MLQKERLKTQSECSENGLRKGKALMTIPNQEIQIIEDMNHRGIRQLDYLSSIEKIASTWVPCCTR
ncbi:MAG: hypothetical protein OXC92_05285 [Flavobacteriaceae bacterium]|nr:hypothetical protein [Flavobacteriaceae bacterium]